MINGFEPILLDETLKSIGNDRFYDNHQDVAFNELTVPESGDGSIVCPKLEALCFRDLKCLDSAVCAESLISMLESRARITATFRDIRFAGPGFTVDSTIRPSRLREYDQERISAGSGYAEPDQVWERRTQIFPAPPARV